MKPLSLCRRAALPLRLLRPLQLLPLLLPLLALAAGTAHGEAGGGPALEWLGPSGSATPSSSASAVAARPCAVDDLIPPHDGDQGEGEGEDEDGGGGGGGGVSDGWDSDNLVGSPPPFDCTCGTLKASYHCPNLGADGYPEWVPRPVSSGACEPTSRETFEREPFPPGFRVLFYGNSHLRQVVESIVCAYASTIETRRVTLIDAASGVEEDGVAVDEGWQCRSCLHSRHAMGEELLANGCVSEEAVEDACTCDDDEAAFEFVNGALAHYHFAHKEDDKRLEDALEVHGTALSDYDAVFANPGNKPHMEVSEALRAAGQLKEAGVPLFWMSTYEGDGDVSAWHHDEQEEFWDSGARFLPVHRMVESLTYLTKGVVEGEKYNPHFCLPGPPTEIGVLLLRIAWALRDGDEGRGEGLGAAGGDGGGDGDGDGDGDGGGSADDERGRH